jgi:ubiquinone/menaquinone biosynthesis C-methylase UbiE
MNYTEIFEERGELYNKAHELYPEARLPERKTFLKWLNPQAGETILVAAAGGGFDAVGIKEILHPNKAEIICVEPSLRFAQQIPRCFRILNAPLADIPIEDRSVDAVACLAALHHVEERKEVFDEWDRILKPGGRMILADVESGSLNGEFLNVCVNEFTPGGHEGKFLEIGELTEEFDARGYENLSERSEDVSWIFSGESAAADFAWHLFGMAKATKSEVEVCLSRRLSLIKIDDEVILPWSLRFFRGQKPGNG